MPRPLPSVSRQPLIDASEVERRRDHKRRELIKRELVAAGLTWGWGAGIVALVVLGVGLLLILNATKMISNSSATFGGLAAVVVISGLIGLSARQHPEIRAAADDLRDRIMALGRAHDFVRPHGPN